jgi:hypothetical protein
MLDTALRRIHPKYIMNGFHRPYSAWIGLIIFLMGWHLKHDGSMISLFAQVLCYTMISALLFLRLGGSIPRRGSKDQGRWLCDLGVGDTISDSLDFVFASKKRCFVAVVMVIVLGELGKFFSTGGLLMTLATVHVIFSCFRREITSKFVST